MQSPYDFGFFCICSRCKATGVPICGMRTRFSSSSCMWCETAISCGKRTTKMLDLAWREALTTCVVVLIYWRKSSLSSSTIERTSSMMTCRSRVEQPLPVRIWRCCGLKYEVGSTTWSLGNGGGEYRPIFPPSRWVWPPIRWTLMGNHGAEEGNLLFPDVSSWEELSLWRRSIEEEQEYVDGVCWLVIVAVAVAVAKCWMLGFFG